MSSFLAMLASSSSEEMEAELKERVESSCKQASCVIEICESLKSTVDQLKEDQHSDSGERCCAGLIIQSEYSTLVYGSVKVAVCLLWGGKKEIQSLLVCSW